MARPTELYAWFADITSLKGVGKKGAEALGRLLRRSTEEDISPRLKDLVFHLPVGVVDRTYSPPLLRSEVGKIITVQVVIEKHSPPKKRGAPYRVTCANDSGSLVLVFFNADPRYLLDMLPAGKDRLISGRLDIFDGVLQMPHPDIIALPKDRDKVMRLEPVYPLTEGMSSRRVGGLVTQALSKLTPPVEWLDAAFLKQQGWKSFLETLKALHAPGNVHDLMPDAPDRLRLAYDELLASQLALALMRQELRRLPGCNIASNSSLAQQVETTLPFTLTTGQQQVLHDIRTDMASGERMLRLVQGDVGSGKTVVALLAAVDVIAAGMQVAIMAPTELLARQHAAGLQQYLSFRGSVATETSPVAEDFSPSVRNDSAVNIALLTGSTKPSEREAMLAEIAEGTAHLIIGTHALFQQKVQFHALGLVVIDEQHRFGVLQRMALSQKGEQPHVLLMTATPIPRSLTMTLYGDLDGSALTEKPPGRQVIDTRAVPLTRLAEVVDAVERAQQKGAKIYWICPLIDAQEGGGDDALQAIETRLATLRARFGARVTLMHGRMKAEERQAVMEGFAGNNYDILVATTVVEVGVDVPEATIIIIENAERFGLAQLHQLRGRVGRSDKPSTCILLYHPECGEYAQARLKVIRDNNDGFQIAEEDLRLRGSGEILGTKQSGVPEFLFADLYQHKDLMQTARSDMKLILERDPTLTSERGLALRSLLYLFGHDQGARWKEGG